MKKTIPGGLLVLAAGVCLCASATGKVNNKTDSENKAVQVLSNASISRWVIASGGLSSNFGYELKGAIGQAVTGVSSGGIYTLKSGYHSEDDLIFRNDLDQ